MYSGDPDRIARLRIMSSFGFGEPRTATMAGLNGKLSEVTALVGRLRLADYDAAGVMVRPAPPAAAPGCCCPPQRWPAAVPCHLALIVPSCLPP